MEEGAPCTVKMIRRTPKVPRQADDFRQQLAAQSDNSGSAAIAVTGAAAPWRVRINAGRPGNDRKTCRE
jgi:hypothetical protein